MAKVVRNARVTYNNVPTGNLELGKHLVYDDSATINLDNVPLNGGILIKAVALSVDPYMRLMMLSAEDTALNAKGMFLNAELSIFGYGIAAVLRSEVSNIRPGQYIHVDELEHAEYSVVTSMTGVRVVDRNTRLPWSVYAGAAGMTGQTAYFGWKEYAPVKKGSTLYVSTGGGAVGSMVIQLAKKDGLRVIASAGSREKVEFMKEVGADVAFNYKETPIREVLTKEGPIDIYWDNVGGDTLDAALENMSVGGTVIICGQIAGYDDDGVPAHRLMKMVYGDIHMVGFGFNNLEYKYLDEFYATIPPKLENGEFKFREEVYYSLEKVPEALFRILKGKNEGKCVVVLSDY
ncbi:hypothetical protein GYMLUDRAFT_75178 [Collybiopsis luxurians FD-317 M1]|uniref:Alcohol dehydrogenase-like C-terminal domain-containing protein n=1 Tax=Collybiopsis luxurians FD-317 M1 TaxID=944289 RepID=A0A0D0C5R0_9AGAR|nr:hypothetical protein GYMLUDRAFT_75178 [Collybiopsis luxurians FD-317 M1]